MARVPVSNSVVARNKPQYGNVLDAYRQGGWRAAADTVLNAPDPGIGPMAVVQKAGAPGLRTMLVKQARRVLASKEYADLAPTLGHIGPGSRRELMAETPMVKRTLQRVGEARTGTPVSLVGHRAESRTGIVPGRGTFFSANPKGAQSFDPNVDKMLTRRQQKRQFVPQYTRVDPVQLKNPYVMERMAGTQGELLTKLGTDKRLPMTLRKAALSAARGHGGERWFTRADKIIAQSLQRLGHDGLIYKDTNEIVDFAGTVNKGTQPTATKAVEKAASAIEKGPRFPRQF